MKTKQYINTLKKEYVMKKTMLLSLFLLVPFCTNYLNADLLNSNLLNEKENIMPNFDGTGPNGLGPKTGRGQGPCNNDASNPEATGQGLGLGRGRGRGMGRGYGRGRGFGCPFNSPNVISKETEVNILKNEAKLLKEELEAIQKQLDSLNK